MNGVEEVEEPGEVQEGEHEEQPLQSFHPHRNKVEEKRRSGGCLHHHWQRKCGGGVSVRREWGGVSGKGWSSVTEAALSVEKSEFRQWKE